jgi:hypothetical protein
MAHRFGTVQQSGVSQCGLSSGLSPYRLNYSELYGIAVNKQVLFVIPGGTKQVLSSTLMATAIPLAALTVIRSG